MLRIKILRMSRNLSQWQLAKDAGMSQGRFSQIERGQIRPLADERAALARLLQTNPGSLFRVVGQIRNPLSRGIR